MYLINALRVFLQEAGPLGYLYLLGAIGIMCLIIIKGEAWIDRKELS